MVGKAKEPDVVTQDYIKTSTEAVQTKLQSESGTKGSSEMQIAWRGRQMVCSAKCVNSQRYLWHNELTQSQ